MKYASVAAVSAPIFREASQQVRVQSEPLLRTGIFAEQGRSIFSPKTPMAFAREIRSMDKKACGLAIIASLFSSPEVLAQSRVTLFGRRTAESRIEFALSDQRLALKR